MSPLEALRDLVAKQPRALSSVAAALWSRAGRGIVPSDLDWARGLGAENMPQLLWEALTLTQSIDSGVLKPLGIQRFLGLLLDTEPDASATHNGDIVLTLPARHPLASFKGDSLFNATKHLLEKAKDTLYITSPYIEAGGIGNLLSSLMGALNRGVRVVILGGNLGNVGSIGSQALEQIRREAIGCCGRLDIYTSTASTDAPRDEHPLLHAKLVVADGEFALVSSANLTTYGQLSNFEVGAVVQGSDVLELTEILRLLLESPLVTHTATIN